MAISSFIETLIPKKFKQSKFDHSKARVIIYSYFVFLATSVVLLLISPFFSDEPLTRYFFSITVLTILIYTFRYSKSLLLPVNIFAFLLAALLVPLTINNGGIYSDNLIWCFLVPVIAFFLGNITSGICWTIALLGFQFYLLRKEQLSETSFLDYVANVSPEYYYISYLFFFMLMAAIIAIFKSHQSKIVLALDRQRATLAEQKQALSEKAEELELIKKNLEYSNKELEQFAYIVSHDLKAPLRNINSFSQLLERSLKKDEVLSPSTQEYLNFITGSVANMNQLITDLITYARAGNTTESDDTIIKIEDIKLRIENDLRSAINETEAQIYWQNMPAEIQVPQVKLVQILQNLISNAIKYKSPNAAPMIIISCFEHEKFWEFSVKDNGVGIAPENQKRIFDIFVKLQSEHYQTSSGIGLTTCKKIIDQLGGEMSVKSQPGIGSVFHFTIPKRRKRPAKTKELAETAILLETGN